MSFRYDKGVDKCIVAPQLGPLNWIIACMYCYLLRYKNKEITYLFRTPIRKKYSRFIIQKPIKMIRNALDCMDLSMLLWGGYRIPCNIKFDEIEKLFCSYMQYPYPVSMDKARNTIGMMRIDHTLDHYERQIDVVLEHLDSWKPYREEVFDISVVNSANRKLAIVSENWSSIKVFDRIGDWKLFDENVARMVSTSTDSNHEEQEVGGGFKN